MPSPFHPSREWLSQIKGHPAYTHTFRELSVLRTVGKEGDALPLRLPGSESNSLLPSGGRGMADMASEEPLGMGFAHSNLLHCHAPPMAPVHSVYWTHL